MGSPCSRDLDARPIGPRASQWRLVVTSSLAVVSSPPAQAAATPRVSASSIHWPASSNCISAALSPSLAPKCLSLVHYPTASIHLPAHPPTTTTTTTPPAAMATNPPQLFLLADHIKLSLLERQRALSLNLPSNSQDGQISRSLEQLRSGIESLESQVQDTSDE